MKQIIIAAIVSLLMIGCGGNKNIKPDDATDPKASMTGEGTDSASSNGSNINAGKYGSEVASPTKMDDFNDPSNPLSKNIIYFDYNSSQVTDINIVNAHGKYLASNPSAKVRLEGHADERGSREFNVALSEQRAQEVKKLMMFQGVRENQTETVAFGEERPLEFGHNERSWGKNRRVEIIYEVK